MARGYASLNTRLLCRAFAHRLHSCFWKHAAWNFFVFPSPVSFNGYGADRSNNTTVLLCSVLLYATWLWISVYTVNSVLGNIANISFVRVVFCCFPGWSRCSSCLMVLGLTGMALLHYYYCVLLWKGASLCTGLNGIFFRCRRRRKGLWANKHTYCTDPTLLFCSDVGIEWQHIEWRVSAICGTVSQQWQPWAPVHRVISNGTTTSA